MLIKLKLFTAVLIGIPFSYVWLLPGNALVADERPNIVLILADDLGWTGLGCYGSEFYETPNIDNLAAEGTRFTMAFSAASNCAPSRATIMSGQYTPKHRVLYVGSGTFQQRWKKSKGNLKAFKMLQPKGETTLPTGEKTIAETLKKAGYRTAMFGKWHLGAKKQSPIQRGFDVAIESHGAHFGFQTEPKVSHPQNQYLSDFLSDQAALFIKRSAKSKEPFFLYYADFLVHKPFEAKDRYLEHFSGKARSKNHKSPMAAAMIRSLDDSVGKILAAIDENGLRENTLVIFTSDNGGLAYQEDGDRSTNTSNYPLRGRKGSEFDGGIRVPWIVQWPKKTPVGVVCDVPIHHVDLFPTFSAVANATQPIQALHGVDLTQLFQSPEKGLPKRNLYWYLPGYSAFHSPSVMVRRGNWKLIRSLENESFTLFETSIDIGETKDVSDDNLSLASALDDAAMKWLDDLDAPRMKPNPEYQR